MIHFVTKNQLPKLKKTIKIDLSICESKEDAILLISKKIRGKDSPDLVSGRSLDALFDVVSDFFMENWLTWGDVCIYGWGDFFFTTPNAITTNSNLNDESLYFSNRIYIEID